MLESKYCNNLCTVRESLETSLLMYKSQTTNPSFDKDDGLDQQELINDSDRSDFIWIDKGELL
jgi:hypothetical protein